MSSKRIVIKNGVVTGFADEVSFEGLNVISFSKKRVSHVIPQAIPLRLAFNVLRAVFQEHSTVASWTRKWKCNWIVRIDGEQFGPFTDRRQAIQFEKQKIYSQGKLGVMDYHA